MSRPFIGFFAAILLCPALALAQYLGPNTPPHKGMSPASVALLRNALAGAGAQPIYIPAALGVQPAQLQTAPGNSPTSAPPARPPQFKIAMISDSPAVPTQPAALAQPADAAQTNPGPAAAAPDETYAPAAGYVDVMYAAHLLLDGGYARGINPLTGGRYPASIFLARTYQLSPRSYWASDVYGPCGYGYGWGYGYGGSSYGCYGPPRFDGLGIYPCAYAPYPYGPPRFDGFGFYPLSGWGYNCGYGYGWGGWGGYGSYPFFANFGTGFFPFNGVVINSGFRFSGNFTSGGGLFRMRVRL